MACSVQADTQAWDVVNADGQHWLPAPAMHRLPACRTKGLVQVQQVCQAGARGGGRQRARLRRRWLGRPRHSAERCKRVPAVYEGRGRTAA